MLKAKYVFIALSAVFSGTLTSCLEDERNPFGEESQDGFYALLPGSTTIYPGSEVELRGAGFTSSDKIYVRKYYNEDDSLTEARITDVTNDRLFFIMPAAFQNNDVYVVIQHNGTNTLLGSLWIRSYTIDSYSYDSYFNIVYIDGSTSDDCKMYFQELDDYSEPIGQSIEIEILEHTEDYCMAQVYPTTRLYTITLEQNGEIAATQTLYNDVLNIDEWYECSPGGTVSLLWEGFIDTDEIVLFDGRNNEIQVDYTIQNGNASFVVPETLEPQTTYDIRLKRYENYDYFYLGYLYLTV